MTNDFMTSLLYFGLVPGHGSINGSVLSMHALVDLPVNSTCCMYSNESIYELPGLLEDINGNYA